MNIGLAFWKAPRRAIYAVKNLRKRCQSKPPVYSSDDDDFMLEPLSKKKRKSPMESQMTRMLEEMKDLKKGVTDYVTLTRVQDTSSTAKNDV